MRSNTVALCADLSGCFCIHDDSRRRYIHKHYEHSCDTCTMYMYVTYIFPHTRFAYFKCYCNKCL